jgi:hypothetical protein
MFLHETAQGAGNWKSYLISFRVVAVFIDGLQFQFRPCASSIVSPATRLIAHALSSFACRHSLQEVIFLLFCGFICTAIKRRRLRAAFRVTNDELTRLFAPAADC